jgi:Right handed beta helix region
MTMLPAMASPRITARPGGRHRRPPARRGAVAVAAAVALAVAVLVVGRGGVRPAEPPPPATLVCGQSAESPVDVARLVADAGPGETVCVAGDALRSTDLALHGEGSAERPVTVVAHDTVVRSVTVTGDHVAVVGFDVEGGEGIVLAGTGLAARGNVVRDAAHDGISCSRPCTDTEIADNTVVRADGSGIIVEGRDITVRGNRVSDSRKIDSPDADGIRFFGDDIAIEDNLITDITDAGYVRDAPHTDCFQTFDNSSAPTVHVTITGNVCRNVDHQCLIATAEEAGLAGLVGRSRDITFSGNFCEVNGSQAVLVSWLPDVKVVSNTLSGPHLDRGAIFLDGSTGGEFRDNDVPGGVRPYELDDASRPGFHADRPG